MSFRVAAHWRARLGICAITAVLSVVPAWSAAPATEDDSTAEGVRRVSSIDFYGVRSLDADTLRHRLTLHEGDGLTRAAANAFRDHPETLLPAMPKTSRLR